MILGRRSSFRCHVTDGDGDTGSNRRPEDDIPKMGRKIVLEKDISDLEDDDSDTPEEIIEKPKIRKKMGKKSGTQG